MAFYSVRKNNRFYKFYGFSLITVKHSGPHYKHITIIMTIAKVMPQFGVTLESSIKLLEASFTISEVSFMMFIVQESFTIISYDCHS